jgi:heme-degrading monooxygenase HmoA
MTMPSIIENRFFTPIVEFHLAPEQQQAFIDEIADEVERHVKRYAGFISSSFHASEDGRRVINYAQWLSKEDWAAFGRTDGADEASAAILEVVKRHGVTPVRGEVGFFRVARVIEKQQSTA